MNTLVDEPKTQAEKLANAIRQEIVRGILRPGERLGMVALQKRFDVGVSPLREALSRLTSLGIVTAEGQRGFRVAQVSVSDLLDVMKTMVWIDGLALRSAIANGDRNWEAEILASAHRLGINNENPSDARLLDEVWEENHRLFHEALVSCAKTPHLLSYRARLFEAVNRYRRLSVVYDRSARDVDGEHRALVDAVLGRDAVSAVEILQEHVMKTARSLLLGELGATQDVDRLMAELSADIAAGN